MAFFAKFRRKLRTKNFEAHFHRKLRTLEKCSNVKKLRTAEPQPIFTGSYKKKVFWFGLSDWDGQVGFVRSGQICKPWLPGFRWFVWLS